MERRNKQATDPLTGRVLTVRISDASKLPADIDSVQYDVSISLLRR